MAISKSPLISIVIVAYHAPDALKRCLKSLSVYRSLLKFEVIVVDNDPEFGLQKLVHKILPAAIYLPQQKNLGFGSGNNVGAKKASGKYLFFLNPDTVMQTGVLENLVAELKRDEALGVVAPALLDEKDAYLATQGATFLTPITVLFAHSIIHRVWPSNPIARKHWYANVDQSSDRYVEVVPGTAFMISKKLFRKIGGFDPNFFLYFEEYDIAKRVAAAGYISKIIGSQPLVHSWGASTQSENSVKMKQYFRESRKYYFSKYYGNAVAAIMEVVLSLRYRQWLLLGIVVGLLCAIYFYV